MTPKENAEAHWGYVKGLLELANPNVNVELCEYMYVTAFIHGWKHADEERDANTK